jgi:hypothetical protein
LQVPVFLMSYKAETQIKSESRYEDTLQHWKMGLAFIWSLLCARYCTGYFTCLVISGNIHNSPAQLLWLITHYLNWKDTPQRGHSSHSEQMAKWEHSGPSVYVQRLLSSPP